MSKRIFAAAVAALALSVAGCDRAEENEVAIENIEDLNATDDLNMGMDMNADLNMDMNATDANATDNATGNAAVDNSANSN